MTTVTPTELEVDECRERPVFLGLPGSAVFACVHLPRRPDGRLVVLCSSVGAEWKYNYRREVILARRLATMGTAAVRLHYLGTGNSDDGDVTFESMLADVSRVRSWAIEQVGPACTVYFGSRFGAFVAAAAGAATHAPLAVWSAPESGARYFSELFRVLRVGRVVGPGASDDAPDPHQALSAGRSLDVLGYTMGPSFYASARERSFEAELGPPPRSVKLIEVADGVQAWQAATGRAAELGRRGYSVDAGWVDEGRSWWFHDADWRPDEERPAVSELIEETAQWLFTVDAEGIEHEDRIHGPGRRRTTGVLQGREGPRVRRAH